MYGPTECGILPTTHSHYDAILNLVIRKLDFGSDPEHSAHATIRICQLITYEPKGDGVDDYDSDDWRRNARNYEDSPDQQG